MPPKRGGRSKTVKAELPPEQIFSKDDVKELKENELLKRLHWATSSLLTQQFSCVYDDLITAQEDVLQTRDFLKNLRQQISGRKAPRTPKKNAINRVREDYQRLKFSCQKVETESDLGSSNSSCGETKVEDGFEPQEVKIEVPSPPCSTSPVGPHTTRIETEEMPAPLNERVLSPQKRPVVAVTSTLPRTPSNRNRGGAHGVLTSAGQVEQGAVQNFLKGQNHLRVNSPHVRACPPKGRPPVPMSASHCPGAKKEVSGPTTRMAAKKKINHQENSDSKIQKATALRDAALAEKTERIRRDQEERQRKVELNRKIKEEEERKRREEARRREQKANELRQVNIKNQKTPSKPSSRVASPSRRLLPSTPATKGVGKNLLFNSPRPQPTPGRKPAKLAKTVEVQDTSEAVAVSSPARSIRRKKASSNVKEEPTDDYVAVFPGPAISKESKNAGDERPENNEVFDGRSSPQQGEMEEVRKRSAIEQQTVEEKDHGVEHKEEPIREMEEELVHEVEKIRSPRQDTQLKPGKLEFQAVPLPLEASGKPTNKHLLNVTNDGSRASTGKGSSSDSYQMTPPKQWKQPTDTNYHIEDISSGDETDDENAPRKIVPEWASWSNLNKSAKEKYLPRPEFERMTLPMPQPDTLPYFANAKKKKRQRGSSAVWSSPMANPTKGKSRFLGY